MQGLCHCKHRAVSYLPVVTESVYRLGKQLWPHTPVHAHTQTCTQTHSDTHNYIGIYTISLHARPRPPVHTYSHTHTSLLQADSRINLKLYPPSFISQYQPQLLDVPYQRDNSLFDLDRPGNNITLIFFSNTENFFILLKNKNCMFSIFQGLAEFVLERQTGHVT